MRYNPEHLRTMIKVYSIYLRLSNAPEASNYVNRYKQTITANRLRE